MTVVHRLTPHSNVEITSRVCKIWDRMDNLGADLKKSLDAVAGFTDDMAESGDQFGSEK